MQESVSNSGSTVVPGIHFAEVRARITLADVLDLLGFVPCESSGDQVRGPCLVHHSISPLSRSFSANLKRHIYRCFKCGSSGNQLDLYAAVTGLGVFEATVALCEQLHREIPWMLNGTSAQVGPIRDSAAVTSIWRATPPESFSLSRSPGSTQNRLLICLVRRKRAAIPDLLSRFHREERSGG